MLYDKRWDSKKNASEDYVGEVSARGLIAWLETQQGLNDFNFCDPSGGCLIGQYLAAFGQFSRANQDRIYEEKIDGEEVGSIISLSVMTGNLHVARPCHGTFADALSGLRARKIAESA